MRLLSTTHDSNEWNIFYFLNFCKIIFKLFVLYNVGLKSNHYTQFQVQIHWILPATFSYVVINVLMSPPLFMRNLVKKFNFRSKFPFSEILLNLSLCHALLLDEENKFWIFILNCIILMTPWQSKNLWGSKKKVIFENVFKMEIEKQRERERER